VSHADVNATPVVGFALGLWLSALGFRLSEPRA